MFNSSSSRVVLPSSSSVVTFCPLSSSEVVIGDQKGYTTIVQYEKKDNSLAAKELFLSNEKSFVRRLTGMVSRPTSVVAVQCLGVQAEPHEDSLRYAVIVTLSSDLVLRVYTPPQTTPAAVLALAKHVLPDGRETTPDGLVGSRLVALRRVSRAELHFVLYLQDLDDDSGLVHVAYRDGTLRYVGRIPTPHLPPLRVELCAGDGTLVVAAQHTEGVMAWTAEVAKSAPVVWHTIRPREVLSPASCPTAFYLSPFDGLFGESANEAATTIAAPPAPPQLLSPGNLDWLEVRTDEDENRQAIEAVLSGIFPIQKTRATLLGERDAVNAVLEKRDRKRFVEFLFQSPRYTKEVLISAVSSLGCETPLKETGKIRAFVLGELDAKMRLARERHPSLPAALVETFFLTIFMLECEKCLFESTSLLGVQYAEKFGGFFLHGKEQSGILRPLTPIETAHQTIEALFAADTLTAERVKGRLSFLLGEDDGLADDVVRTLVSARRVVADVGRGALYFFDEQVGKGELPSKVAREAVEHVVPQRAGSAVPCLRPVAAVLATLARMLGEQPADGQKYNVKLSPFYSSGPVMRYINTVVAQTAQNVFLIARELLLFCTVMEAESPFASLGLGKLHRFFNIVVRSAASLVQTFNKKHTLLPVYTRRFKEFIYAARNPDHNIVQTLNDCAHAYIKAVSPLSVLGSATIVKQLAAAGRPVARLASLLPPFPSRAGAAAFAYFHHWKALELVQRASVLVAEAEQHSLEAALCGDSGASRKEEGAASPACVVAVQERVVEELLAIVQSIERFSPRKALGFVDYITADSVELENVLRNVCPLSRRIRAAVVDPADGDQDYASDDDDVEQNEDIDAYDERPVAAAELKEFEETSIGTALVYCLISIRRLEQLHGAAKTLALHTLLLLEQRRTYDVSEANKVSKSGASSAKPGETIASFARARVRATHSVESALAACTWKDQLPDFARPEFRDAFFTGRIKKELHSVLLCTVFRHALSTGDVDAAFHAIVQNSVKARSVGCLASYVDYCCKRGDVKALVSTGYPILLEKKMIAILEQYFAAQDVSLLFDGAASAPVPALPDGVEHTDFASLLSAYYLSKSDYIDAARVLIMLALKLLSLPLSRSVLRKMQESLLVALNSLSLLDEKDAWVYAEKLSLPLRAACHDESHGTTTVKLGGRPLFVIPKAGLDGRLAECLCPPEAELVLCGAASADAFRPSLEMLREARSVLITRADVQGCLACVTEALEALRFYQTLLRGECRDCAKEPCILLTELDPALLCAHACALREYRRALVLASSQTACPLVDFVVRSAAHDLAAQERRLADERARMDVLVSKSNRRRAKDLERSMMKRRMEDAATPKKRMRFSIGAEGLEEDEAQAEAEREDSSDAEKEEQAQVISALSDVVKGLWVFLENALAKLEPACRVPCSDDTACPFHNFLVLTLLENGVRAPDWLVDWMSKNAPCTLLRTVIKHQSDKTLFEKVIDNIQEKVFNYIDIDIILILFLTLFLCFVLFCLYLGYFILFYFILFYFCF